MAKKHNRFWPFLILTALLLHAPAFFPQNMEKIDSLKTSLREFEAEKAALGSNAPEMIDTLKVRLLSKLANNYFRNDPDQTLHYANLQLAISKKLKYKWGIAGALNMLGNIADYNRDYDRALPLFMRALQLYTEIGDDLLATNVYNNIGVLYAKKGIYTEGLKYMLTALEISKKKHDDQGLVSTYNNIGVIYRNLDKTDKALKYYLKCLNVQLKHNGKYALSYSYQNIGELYRMKKQRAIALKFFKLGLQEAIKEHDNSSIANNYSSIGSTCIDAKDFVKAIENHQTALAIREKAEDGYGMFTSYICLGDIYLQTGNNAKALAYTQQAYDLIKDRGELNMLAEVYRQLAEIYAVSDNYKMAYQSNQSYKKLNDSIFNADNERKLTEQQLNFDFRSAQEKKDLLSKAALQNQKNIRNYTLGGLVLIALLVILALARRHKKNTIALQLELTIREIEAQALKAENENIGLRNELIALENNYEKKENEELQQKLDFNRRQLASTTLFLYQKNEMLSGLKKDIDALPQGSIPPVYFDSIKTKIQDKLFPDTDWDKFRLHFEQVHPDFFKELHEKHPGLTAYEMRLYAYLHIKLSTKEIAGLLNITPESVIKSKVRLNKKLNLTDADSTDAG